VVVGLVFVLVLASGFPAQAQYTKSYLLYNTTGLDQDSVRAVTFGMEYITAMASDPYLTEMSGFLYMGGLWNSTIDCSNGTAVDGGTATVAWTTWDLSCFLWDVRWGDGTAAVPEQLSGMPGGGILVQENGTWVWYIINDTGYALQLNGLQQGTFLGAPLGYGDLGEVGELGIAGKRVADITEAILGDDGLIASIEEAQALELLPNPSANSLIKKAYRCLDNVLQGLEQFDLGDLDRAHFYWGQALKQIENLKKELHSLGARDLIKDAGLLEEWLAAADYVIGEINGLLGIEPFDVTQPGLTQLPPDGELRIELSDVNPGDAVVLTGLVVDNGAVLASWTDQVVIPFPPDPDADVTPPVVTAAVNADPNENGWYNAAILDGAGGAIEVTLTASESPQDPNPSGVAGIYVGVDPDDLVPVGPGQEPTLQISFEPGNEVVLPFVDDGVYTIYYTAVDNAGNISDDPPQELEIKIDTTVPVITVVAGALYQDIWPPDHEMVPIVTVAAEDEGSKPTLYANVQSNEPEVGDGSGDHAPDYELVVLDVGLPPNQTEGTLYVRRERCGNLRTREYTIQGIWAEDLAGNTSEVLSGLVRVYHDEGT
jgi:hypothetical protein